MPFDAATYHPDCEALLATPDAMLAWLRTKAPHENVATSKMDNRDCLMARFQREHGHPRPCVGGITYDDCDDKECSMPIWFWHPSRYSGVWPSLPGSDAERIPITAAQALEAFAEAGHVG